jgi:hypothetical protein
MDIKLPRNHLIKTPSMTKDLWFLLEHPRTLATSTVKRMYPGTTQEEQKCNNLSQSQGLKY